MQSGVFWWRVHAMAREADLKLSWTFALGKSYLLCSPLHQAMQHSVAQTELAACSDERACWPSDNCSLRGREGSINQNESSAPGLCLTWHGSNPPHQPQARPEEAKGPGELWEMVSVTLVLYQPWWINTTPARGLQYPAFRWRFQPLQLLYHKSIGTGSCEWW